MSISSSPEEALSFDGFPGVSQAHWETENRIVWNERERANEPHELVYEISWISELGVWRRFLRSRRKLNT